MAIRGTAKSVGSKISSATSSIGSKLGGTAANKVSTTNKTATRNSSGSGGSSSSSSKPTVSNTPTYKTVAYTESGLKNVLKDYGNDQAKLESYLNSKGYTLGGSATTKTVTPTVATKTIYSPGASTKISTGSNLSNIAGSGKSTVETASDMEKISKLNTTKSNTNDVVIGKIKTSIDKDKDSAELKIAEKLKSYNGVKKEAALKTVNDKLKATGYVFDLESGKLLKTNTDVEGKGVTTDSLNKGLKEFEDTTAEALYKKEQEREKTAEEQTDLVKIANEEKEERRQERLDLLKNTMDKYTKEIEERKAEIDKATDLTKSAQNRAANIAAAVAGQGAGVTVGEMTEVGTAAAQAATANIAEAQRAAAESKAQLDLQLKNAGFDEGSALDSISNILDTYTDDEYKYFLNQLDASGGDAIKAIEAVEATKLGVDTKVIDESYERYAKEKRIDEQEKDFAKENTLGKVQRTLEALYGENGSGYIDSDDITSYLTKNPNATFKEVASHFRKQGQTIFDKLQNTLTTMPIAIQTEYNKDPKVKAWVQSLIK